MLHAATSLRGMVTAPHHLAAQAGLSVLREGGNAIEAMVAAAATIAVVYPHMNGIGGDGFWLIYHPRRTPIAIDACGPAGGRVTADLYRRCGLDAIPSRGPLAANTVAGTIGGWHEALVVSAEWGGVIPLQRLLEEAIYYAEEGTPVSLSQAELALSKLDELCEVHGFATAFLPDGSAPAVATRLRQERLGASLRHLARAGLDDFYRGELGRRIAADLERAGSPLAIEDLAAYHARQVESLSVRLARGTTYNLPPPTQGLASLMILGIFDRLGVATGEGFDHLHGLVEATKQAFLVRDREIADPEAMRSDPRMFLSEVALAAAAARIDRAVALPWPRPSHRGDTIWMGAIDGEGRAVSFIQSIYWEFGSGVVLEDSGVLWQNRGSSFALDPSARNALHPGRRPFHTLNPALALLDDGRVMVYGTMGGEGQPQTQAAIFTRHVLFGQELQQAITAPRWLLGRTWGADTTTLKLESRLDPALTEALRKAGHIVEVVPPFSDLMGHAGAIVRYGTGILEGAADPRADGCPAGF